MRKKKLMIPSFDKTVDRLNLGLVGLFCVLLLVIVFLKFSKPRSVEQIMSATDNARAELPLLKLSKKSSKYYQRILGRRELFVAQPGLRVKKVLGRTDLDRGERLRGADLQLLGIVSGAQGPQAILVDSKTGRSFYCSGGEKINDFTVKAVFENKVILERDEELIEIKL